MKYQVSIFTNGPLKEMDFDFNSERSAKEFLNMWGHIPYEEIEFEEIISGLLYCGIELTQDEFNQFKQEYFE